MPKISIFQAIRTFFMRLRVKLLFHFRLKPRIKKMSVYVSQLANLRSSIFPLGKSVLTFQGEGDVLYFVMLKDDMGINVVEVFDELLNKLPENYQILQQIPFKELAAV